MRTYLSVASLLAGAIIGNLFPVQAQSARSLPGCEAAPEVRKVLDKKLDPNLLDKMKLPERVALERQVLDDLITKYPRELEPYQTLINRLRSEDPDQYAELRNRLGKMAKDDPNDPLALLLAGCFGGKIRRKVFASWRRPKQRRRIFPGPSRNWRAITSAERSPTKIRLRKTQKLFLPFVLLLRTALRSGCLRKTLRCCRK